MEEMSKSGSVENWMLQRSISLKEDCSISERMVGIFSSSWHCAPQPRTRAMSLPVPRGTTPIIHCRGKRERGGKGGEEGERGGRESVCVRAN